MNKCGVGIVAWVERCLTFSERMQEDFVHALVDFDAAVARADLPGLHAACLSSLRQRISKTDTQQHTGSSPQNLSLNRMEERVDQLKEQLATANQAAQTMHTKNLGLEKENATLLQVLHPALSIAVIST